MTQVPDDSSPGIDPSPFPTLGLGYKLDEPVLAHEEFHSTHLSRSSFSVGPSPHGLALCLSLVLPSGRACTYSKLVFQHVYTVRSLRIYFASLSQMEIIAGHPSSIPFLDRALALSILPVLQFFHPTSIQPSASTRHIASLCTTHRTLDRIFILRSSLIALCLHPVRRPRSPGLSFPCRCRTDFFFASNWILSTKRILIPN
jgi:hypothetical protein